MMIYSKLLSHRLRGFSAIELSPSAMKNACETDVPYLEVDTRVSADGKIYLFHEPVFTNGRISHPFASTPSEIFDRFDYPSGEKLLSLELALEIFCHRKLDRQLLCIDIKDYGFEKDHLDLIRAHRLESNVCFVSWIPQVLVRLHELGSNCPLILSHWNIHRFSILGRLLTKPLKHGIVSVKHFALLTCRHALPDLGPFKQGYQHVLIAQKLPMQLESILRETKGGICIPRFLVNPALLNYCRTQNFQLWIFSVETADQYRHYAQSAGIDVIFCDDVPAVINASGAG